MALSEQQQATLLSALARPTQSTSIDGLSVGSRSVSELIQALNYSKSLESQTPGRRAFRLQFFRAPGMIHGAS